MLSEQYMKTVLVMICLVSISFQLFAECRDSIESKVCMEDISGNCKETTPPTNIISRLKAVHDKLDPNVQKIFCSLDMIRVLDTKKFYAEIDAPNLTVHHSETLEAIPKPPYNLRLSLEAFQLLSFQESLTKAEIYSDLLKDRNFKVDLSLQIQASGSINQDPDSFLLYVILHEMGHFFDSNNAGTDPRWFAPIDPSKPLPPEAYLPNPWNEVSSSSPEWLKIIKMIKKLRDDIKIPNFDILSAKFAINEIYRSIPSVPSLSIYSIAGNGLFDREDFAETFAYYYLHKKFPDLRIENLIDGQTVYSLTDQLYSKIMKSKIEILERKIKTAKWSMPK